VTDVDRRIRELGSRYGVSDDGWTLLELEGLASRPGAAA
jgi:hypothetical protein